MARPQPSNVVRILNVPISKMGMQEALEYCRQRVQSGMGGYVCFANVHTVTEAQGKAEVYEALSQSTCAVADGVPLVWVSRLKGDPISSRVCGPDFMREFLRNNPSVSYAFVGGAPGQSEELARRFGVEAVCYSPPMRPFSEAHAQEDWKNVRSLALASAKQMPSVVWVGLGAPKQEMWMQSLASTAPETLFFGVGAAFDFLTGTKRRAPPWMQKSGLEWFYRLVQEPKRLVRRYLVTNFLFVIYLVGFLKPKTERYE